MIYKFDFLLEFFSTGRKTSATGLRMTSAGKYFLKFAFRRLNKRSSAPAVAQLHNSGACGKVVNAVCMA
jgi:hypothetical protein